MTTATMEKPKTDPIINGATTQPATTEPRQLSPFQKTKGWLTSDDFKAAVAAAMPKHMTPDRFVRIALTAMMKVPELANCTQESIFNCLLQLSQYGLEPDGRRAHLIPFKVNKKVGRDWVYDHTDCTLIIDFKGYAELVMRSGLVSSVHADIVCENDEFEYDRGFITKHRIDFKKPRGEAYAAYAVVRFKDGTEKCEVMTKDDIHAIRDRSQGWKSFKNGYAKQSPWNPEEPIIEHEMWKKTAFRRLTKWVPLSAEIRDAISVEEQEEVRLIDLRERERLEALDTVVPGTKSDQLVAEMQKRLDAQQSESQHDEPPHNGEESQAPPEPTESQAALIDGVAKRISAAIKAAVVAENFDALANEISLIEDDDIRVRLYAEHEERMVKLGLKKVKTQKPLV